MSELKRSIAILQVCEYIKKDAYGFERDFKEYVTETTDTEQKKILEVFTKGGYPRKIKINPSLKCFKA